MRETLVSINVSDNKSTFLLNGKSPDPRGIIARFTGEPFLRWRDQIIQVLDETYGEDGYQIEFRGQAEQFNSLKELADNSEACKGCTYYPDDSKATPPKKGVVAGAALNEGNDVEVFLPASLYVGDRVALRMNGISADDLDFEYILPENDTILHYQNGVIEGRKAGKVSVRCKRKGTVDRYIASGTIVVQTHNLVTDIVVGEAPSSMYVGEQKQLYVDLVPSNAENARSLRFVSANENVLRVSKIGRVTAVGPGPDVLRCLPAMRAKTQYPS